MFRPKPVLFLCVYLVTITWAFCVSWTEGCFFAVVPINNVVMTKHICTNSLSTVLLGLQKDEEDQPVVFIWLYAKGFVVWYDMFCKLKWDLPFSLLRIIQRPFHWMVEISSLLVMPVPVLTAWSSFDSLCYWIPGMCIWLCLTYPPLVPILSSFGLCFMCALPLHNNDGCPELVFTLPVPKCCRLGGTPIETLNEQPSSLWSIGVKSHWHNCASCILNFCLASLVLRNWKLLYKKVDLCF